MENQRNEQDEMVDKQGKDKQTLKGKKTKIPSSGTVEFQS
jgi:hypothetical protein